MREKNVKRAAHALYMSQADDKNDLLARFVSDRRARDLVKDQGRALIILEKIILPHGKDAYEESEMFQYLLKKLKKKGHRIQGDEEEDTEQYAAEKKQWSEARKAKVPELFGVSLDDEDPENKKSDLDEKIDRVERTVERTRAQRVTRFGGVASSSRPAPESNRKIKLRSRPKAAIMVLCRGRLI